MVCLLGLMVFAVNTNRPGWEAMPLTLGQTQQMPNVIILRVSYLEVMAYQYTACPRHRSHVCVSSNVNAMFMFAGDRYF